MKTQVNLLRRILLTGLLCLLFAVIVPVRAHADNPHGDCGASGNESGVQWSYDTDTTTLTISGSGKMAGYVEAFSFNLLQDGKTTYDKRQNALTISIPWEYQKSGRSYKVIGINKQGKPLTFEDTDTNTGTITININGFDGYF